MPSIQPKPKTDVLDKIIAEIEQEYLAEGHLSDYWDGIDKCLQIVDKYKTESGHRKVRKQNEYRNSR